MVLLYAPSWTWNVSAASDVVSTGVVDAAGASTSVASLSAAEITSSPPVAVVLASNKGMRRPLM